MKRYKYINNIDCGEHRIRKQNESKQKQTKAKESKAKAKESKAKANESKQKQKKTKLSKEKLSYNLLIRVWCNNPVTL